MNLRNKLNLYRRYPYWAAKRCIFIHIPRAAGTSINNALYGRPLGHYQSIEIRRKFPRLFEKCFVFAFVRNPWDRVLSAYRFAVMGRTESMGIANSSAYQIPEFDSFERFLIDWLDRQDILALDYVFQPQHVFVSDRSGNVIVDFVGQIESMQADIAHVGSVLGRQISVSYINQTGNVGVYRDAYTRKSMIEVVERKYEKDIAKFGYSF